MTMTEDTIARILKKNRGVRVTSIKRLPGGFNCSVFKLHGSDKQAYIAKKYIEREDDPTSRLLAEFQSLTFLWKHGIRAIPEPICMSKEDNIGMYQFIAGTRFAKGAYSHHDIREATNFWRSIHILTREVEAKSLPVAKDACFRLDWYFTSVENRFVVLSKLPRTGQFAQLHEFLGSEFTPFYRQVRRFIEVECRRQRLDTHEPLSHAYRTLSPSDFGFHNAIRTTSGNIVFHDFEYFGWDDPVKMISDFYLHPRMTLPFKLREFFFKNVYNALSSDLTLPQRLPFVYLLLALKWCLIMLNVFRHEEIVLGRHTNRAKVQLEKARNQLTETIAELDMRSFPLSLLL